MFQGYVNFTRILFTLSFISCIVCFVFGCLAYSNRERRIWYKTLGKIFQRIYVLEFLNIFKGWILIAISLVTLISLIIFPGSTSNNNHGFLLHALFMKTFSWIPQALSYLRQLVLWCWLRFRMGCLMFECESFIIYHWPTHLNFYLDLGRRFIHSWSWSTKQKTFHCRKAHSYLRVSAAFISSINTETSSIDCNKPLIARSCIIQINVPSAFEFILLA